MPPIMVRLKPLEATRSPDRSCLYFAFTRIDGKRYGAWSRNGASHELARKLVAAGIPDAPMHVSQRGIAGHIAYRSFHAMARYAFEENASMPLRRRRWVDPLALHAKLAGSKAPKQGVKPDPATGGPPGVSGDVLTAAAPERGQESNDMMQPLAAAPAD